MKKVLLVITFFAFMASITFAQSNKGWTLPPKKTETATPEPEKKKADKKTVSDDVYDTGKKNSDSEESDENEVFDKSSQPADRIVFCNTCPPENRRRYPDMTMTNLVVQSQQVVDYITYPQIYYQLRLRYCSRIQI